MKKIIRGWLLFFLMLLTSSSYAVATPVPDTGQTICYNADGTEITCPASGQPFYGQDAQYAINQQSFTRMDENGIDLPDSAPSWAMVRDNVTGLIWEMKNGKNGITDYSNPHDADNIYTWYDPTDSEPGTFGNGTDSKDFIDALNTANFGGYNDWRMPSIREQADLVNYSIPNPRPTIDASYFPNTQPSTYWSGTSVFDDRAKAWAVDFNNAVIGWDGQNKSNSNFVRAVRGAQTQPDYVDNGDGTVTDRNSGLMWQQETTTRTWEQALSHCEDSTIGGYTDWRLPTIKELRSLANFNRSNPAINITYFPNTPVYFFWSGTTFASIDGDFNQNSAWALYFSRGGDAYGQKFYDGAYVRAVRGAPSTISNNPPNLPSWPLPVNQATGVSVTAQLNWTGGDPDEDDTVIYDVYFGTSSTPELVASNLTVASYNPAMLNYSTTYYWKIVARDSHGAERIGPIWSFTTIQSGMFVLSGHLYDADGNGVCGASISLSGSGSSASGVTGADGSYSIPMVAGSYNISVYYSPGMTMGASCPADALKYPYYTQNDSVPVVISGDTVKDFSLPRTYTVSGRILDQSGNGMGNANVYFTNTSTMMYNWTMTAADGSYSVTLFPGTYDVQFSKDGNSFIGVQGWAVNGDVPSQNFDWGVTIVLNKPPNTPSLPLPGNQATGVVVTAQLNWTGGDPNAGDTVSYDVYFGTSSTPELVVSNLTVASYNPGTLNYGTTYYWKVVARDSQGVETIGPIWSFTAIQSGMSVLSGYFYDADGNGVCGVSISLNDINTGSLAYGVTGVDGSYSIPIIAGTYNISVNYYPDMGMYGTCPPDVPKYPNYYQYAFDTVVISGDTIKDFSLPQVYTVSGCVLDQSGNGVGNASVSFQISSNPALNCWTTTAADGSYSVSLYAGTYDVRFSKDGVSFVGVQGLAVNGDIPNQNFNWGTGNTLSGHFFDADGNGVCGVSISLNNNTGSSGFATTGPDGSYSIPMITGAYNISVNYYPMPAMPAGGFCPADAPTYPSYMQYYNEPVVISGDTVKDFSLPRTYTISGRLLDQSGNGVGNADVYFQSTSNTFYNWTTTAADGSYSIALYASTYDANFSKDGNSFVGVQGLAVNGDMPNQNFNWGVTIVFRSIHGTVYLQNGMMPITGESVRIEVYSGDPCNNEYAAWADTSVLDGTYSFTGLPDGTWYAQAGRQSKYYSEWYGGNGSDCHNAVPIDFMMNVFNGINFSLTPFKKGDVNADRNVDLADAILGLKVVTGMNPGGIDINGDVNGDRKIGIKDVLYILQITGGIR